MEQEVGKVGGWRLEVGGRKGGYAILPLIIFS